MLSYAVITGYVTFTLFLFLALPLIVRKIGGDPEQHEKARQHP